MPAIDTAPSHSNHCTLVDLLGASMAHYHDRTALVSLGGRLTYSELDRHATRWVTWLSSQGLAKGARVAIMLPNVMASTVTLLGTLRAGLTVVNINPLYTARELQAQLLDCEPEVLVVFEAFAATVQKLPQTARPRRIVVVAAGDLLGPLKGFLVNLVVHHVQRKVPAWELEGSYAFRDTLRQASGNTIGAADIQPDDVAFLQYTGGTTGEPRAAMLTHGNVVANILQVDEVAQPAIGDLLPAPLTMLTALPLYHVFAMTVCELYPLYRGMRVVLIINPRDLKALTAVWRKESPHIFPAVNTLFAGLLKFEEFKKLDFSKLRIALGGGMAVQAAVAKQWQALTGRTIIEGYGMSETSPVICANPTDGREFSGTVGFPLPGTDVRILNDQHQTVADGELGEIAVRGPQVMTNYWRADSETVGDCFTADGYFLTGDLGFQTPNGQVRIVDRKKDVILVSGFNVYPAELDAVFANHPDVADCAAVGVPDDVTGQAVRLYVVPAIDSIDMEALRQWGQQNLAGYKRPRDICLIGSLPKNTVGKTLRRALRDQSV